jgi:hypothetical protein
VRQGPGPLPEGKAKAPPADPRGDRREGRPGFGQGGGAPPLRPGGACDGLPE